jgi:hypothetical protein
MLDKIELDLNNPIFAAYVDVSNLSPEKAEEILRGNKKMFDIYKNITIWVVASDETKIECVYDGRSRIREIELNDLIKEINTRIDIMSQSHSFEDFKINIRDWRINNIIDGDNQE